jgi:hypothetical protein
MKINSIFIIIILFLLSGCAFRKKETAGHFLIKNPVAAGKNLITIEEYLKFIKSLEDSCNCKIY